MKGFDQSFDDAVNKKLGSIDIEDACDDDRAFFELNPKRSHRVRRAYTSEEDQFRVLAVACGQGPMEVPTGLLLCVAVRQIGPGVRYRSPYFGWMSIPADELAQESEQDARALWDHLERSKLLRSS